mmetsp:Transcript_14593/g.30590  ORF Transcript_14593/g.30590 Transcript_14593/m.30590 type:complete len:794 (+) Transcript_14593:77-2458(+)
MPANQGNLGVTMTLPPGTCSRLEQQRSDELKRRESKLREKELEKPEMQPRRLAPQKRNKTVLSPKVPLMEEGGGANSAETIPIDISINTGLEKNEDVVGVLFDDMHGHDTVERTDQVWDGDGKMKKITKTVADWKLNIIDPSEHSTNLDEEEQEEQEYHGEIESDEENSATTPGENSVAEEEEIDGGFAVIDEDSVPLDPPPSTMPMVLVNLEALCGCAPSDEAEKEVLVAQLMEALLGLPPKDDDAIKEEKHNQKKVQNACNGDGLSLDFDARVVELFDSGVASHVDSSSPIVVANNAQNETALGEEKREEEQVNPYAIVPYPEFLSSPISGSIARSTVRLWKLLHTPHPVRVVARVFTHLRNTSRSLLWKVDMHQELRRLAIMEHKEQLRRNKMEQYDEWKNSARQERLDRLYEVRETFLMRVDIARRKYEAFAKEREGRVKRELWRRRGGRSKNFEENVDGKTTFSEMLNGNNECGDEDYDEDGWGGVIREDDILGDESFDDDDKKCEQVADSEGVTEQGPVGMSIFVESNTPKQSESGNKTDKTSVNDKLFDKLETITVRDIQQRKIEKIQKLKARANHITTNHEFLEKEEESIREMLKSNDERLAEAALRSLEKRLESVDELLESLQEEQWAEDEAAEEDKDRNDDIEAPDTTEQVNDNGMTLLDQILAMVLGGLRIDCSGAKTNEEHFKYIKNQHALIVREWKEVFGRLPPYPSSQTEPGVVEANVADSHSTNLDYYTEYEDFLSATNDFREDSRVASRNLRDDKEIRGNFTEDYWDEVEDWDAFLP